MYNIEEFNGCLFDLMTAFGKKQRLSFDYWVEEESVCGIASYSGRYFFEFKDIYIDMVNNVRAGIIKDYHDSMLDVIDVNECLLTPYVDWLQERNEI